jgi:hypothetical protein
MQGLSGKPRDWMHLHPLVNICLCLSRNNGLWDTYNGCFHWNLRLMLLDEYLWIVPGYLWLVPELCFCHWIINNVSSFIIAEHWILSGRHVSETCLYILFTYLLKRLTVTWLGNCWRARWEGLDSRAELCSSIYRHLTAHLVKLHYFIKTNILTPVDWLTIHLLNDERFNVRCCIIFTKNNFEENACPFAVGGHLWNVSDFTAHLEKLRETEFL